MAGNQAANNVGCTPTDRTCTCPGGKGEKASAEAIKACMDATPKPCEEADAASQSYLGPN
jgi:hypothetical protein